jgi:hypothetical protein
MKFSATIEHEDETITVTGDVFEERNERGLCTVVILDEPHDTADYRHEAESALIEKFEIAQLEARDN